MSAPAQGGKRSKLLPDNAYRRLSPGESYNPIVVANDGRAEVTLWSVALGLIMVALFSGACIYMALRAGNAIEAAIPIAILAIFFGKMRKVRSTILENVIVQSIGQASGVVAAGAAFLVPALYINGVTPTWWQIFLACFIGGSLGVALIIPLRKYFVKDLHGDLPFPEATAINEILVSGESAGATAGKVLIVAFVVGAAYDFMVEGMSLWPMALSTSHLPGGIGEAMSAGRFEVSMWALAALFGLGYIIGLKYAAIIAAGSILAWMVFVPLVHIFGSQAAQLTFAGGTYKVAEMSAGQIFGEFVKPIGIGAIAVSGIIGIIRMGKIVVGSVSLGFKGFATGAAPAQEPRTQTDMHPKNVLLVQFGMVLLMAALFFLVAILSTDSVTGESYTGAEAFKYAAVGAIVGFALSFLFTPVAAQAIATVGTNPVSGMTLITVALTILVLVAFQLKGSGGMFVALIVGTAVCTALSTSGALITDFKIGYWIGATPRAQERWKFLGLAVAALVVAFVIPIMDSSYGFVKRGDDGQLLRDAQGNLISNQDALPAPQANMIAAVSRGLLDDPAKQPWLAYGLGGIMAVILYLASVPMLAFALGMYLPIGINLAVLFGAFTAWIISKTGGSERVRLLRTEQGTLIASGLMAGAAILGIITAVLRIPSLMGMPFAPIRFLGVGVDYSLETSSDGTLLMLKETGAAEYFENGTGQAISLLMFIGLAVVCYFLARWGATGQMAEEDAADKSRQGQ